MSKALLNSEKIVERILEDMPITRKNDNLLFIEYWRRVAPDVSFIDFYKDPFKYKGVQYKSVERNRRKIQSRRPELEDPKTVIIRAGQEMEYYQYGIGG